MVFAQAQPIVIHWNTKGGDDGVRRLREGELRDRARQVRDSDGETLAASPTGKPATSRR